MYLILKCILCILSYIDNFNTNVITTCDKIIIIPPNFDNIEIK